MHVEFLQIESVIILELSCTSDFNTLDGEGLQQLRIREQTTQGRNAKANRLNCPHIKKLGNKYKSVRDQLAKDCKQYHQHNLLHYDNLPFYLNFTNARISGSTEQYCNGRSNVQGNGKYVAQSNKS
ncbi:hypothetical protein T4B_8127 [Trichinella pseudospiralis]|uniref:Uncharacterized protein n=1 Tax=Trichinella pseudospiralis TaxID=6337 RepID=A0A0V1JAS3_TRIPS|nr:hypothetical protein T4A_2786 [Trichinella pseudospiralis]KRZ32020.1 hypothetical protein T4B_8127 [Trichinella pseudospiralis]KRZ46198.1 hypothetical protein T4C_11137 [Trichinella pseudospiralis]